MDNIHVLVRKLDKALDKTDKSFVRRFIGNLNIEFNKRQVGGSATGTGAAGGAGGAGGSGAVGGAGAGAATVGAAGVVGKFAATAKVAAVAATASAIVVPTGDASKGISLSDKKKLIKSQRYVLAYNENNSDTNLKKGALYHSPPLFSKVNLVTWNSYSYNEQNAIYTKIIQTVDDTGDRQTTRDALSDGSKLIIFNINDNANIEMSIVDTNDKNSPALLYQQNVAGQIRYRFSSKTEAEINSLTNQIVGKTENTEFILQDYITFAENEHGEAFTKPAAGTSSYNNWLNTMNQAFNTFKSKIDVSPDNSITKADFYIYVTSNNYSVNITNGEAKEYVKEGGDIRDYRIIGTKVDNNGNVNSISNDLSTTTNLMNVEENRIASGDGSDNILEKVTSFFKNIFKE